MTVCARCSQPKPIKGRGLCNACFLVTHRAGTHIDYPRKTRSIDETMADYRLLRSEGHTDRQIAERLGMKLSALRRARQRAAKREVA